VNWKPGFQLLSTFSHPPFFSFPFVVTCLTSVCTLSNLNFPLGCSAPELSYGGGLFGGYSVCTLTSCQVWGHFNEQFEFIRIVHIPVQKGWLVVDEMEEVKLVKEIFMNPRLVIVAKMVQSHHNLELNPSPPIGSADN
jgi:hypothetical protein